jgi:sulfur carrier protein ThiS
MSIDAQTTNPLLSGTALQQSGTFNNASLNSVGLIYTTGVTGTGSGSLVEAGLFTPDSHGNFTFAGDKNSGGSVSTDSFSGTYTVAASGRTLISKTGSTNPDILEYLASPNSGFVLSTNSQVSSNFAQAVIAGPLTDASLQGTFAFATINSAENADPTSAGVLTFDGSGTESGAVDSNVAGYLTSGATVTQSYAVSANGRTVLPSTGATQTVVYIIFGQKVAILDYQAGNSNPTLKVAEQ